jgi:Protein of unknown function (DUF3300)
MKHASLSLLLVLGCAPGIAQTTSAPAPAVSATAEEPAPLTPAQIDQLLAPIALHPDPLVAIILPASTYPADIVLAARFVAAGGGPETFDAQAWDDSVKALARHPELLKWMDENLDWTRQIGAAFLRQPAEVLTGTQRLRAAARAAGNLTDTPEQTVVVESQAIRIVPARHDIIHVPIYDPLWVYRPRAVNFYHPAPLIRFSTGYRTGSWLSYHCDWGYNTVVVINRPHRVTAWHHYPRWSCPAPSVSDAHRVWHRPAHTRPVHTRPGLAYTPPPREREPAALVPHPVAASRPAREAATTTATPQRRASVAEHRAPVNRRPETTLAPRAIPRSPAPAALAPQAEASPRVSRRIPSATTEQAGGSALDFRSRPALPSAAPASSRMERHQRPASAPSAASAKASTPAPRRSAAASAPMPTPRRAAAATATASLSPGSAAAEADPTLSRRAR